MFGLHRAIWARYPGGKLIAMLGASVLAGWMLSAGYAFAQSAAPRPQFEVASIKLNKSGELPLLRALHVERFALIKLPMQIDHVKRPSGN